MKIKRFKAKIIMVATVFTILFLYPETGAPLGELFPATVWSEEKPARSERSKITADLKENAAKPDLSKGKKIFLQYCSLCHGSSGKGDGPAAAGLNPKTGNFKNGIFKYGSGDANISNIIKKGKGAMPPWGSVLSDKDIEEIILYIRSLKE